MIELRFHNPTGHDQWCESQGSVRWMAMGPPMKRGRMKGQRPACSGAWPRELIAEDPELACREIRNLARSMLAEVTSQGYLQRYRKRGWLHRDRKARGMRR